MIEELFLLPAPLSESFPPRWLYLLLGGIVGSVGLFFLIYVSAFLFSNNLVHGGVICIVASLLVFSFSLFLIHEGLK